MNRNHPMAADVAVVKNVSRGAGTLAERIHAAAIAPEPSYPSMFVLSRADVLALDAQLRLDAERLATVGPGTGSCSSRPLGSDDR